MEIKNIKKIILYSFFLIYLIIGLITLEDYGVNIEEHTQIYSGYWLNYIFNFFEIEFLKGDLSLILDKISGDLNLQILQNIHMGRCLMFNCIFGSFAW